jgi:hypothetical protein
MKLWPGHAAFIRGFWISIVQVSSAWSCEAGQSEVGIQHIQKMNATLGRIASFRITHGFGNMLKLIMSTASIDKIISFNMVMNCPSPFSFKHLY